MQQYRDMLNGRRITATWQDGCIGLFLAQVVALNLHDMGFELAPGYPLGNCVAEYQIENVPAAIFLDRMAAYLGCSWEVDDQGAIRLHPLDEMPDEARYGGPLIVNMVGHTDTVEEEYA